MKLALWIIGILLCLAAASGGIMAGVETLYAIFRSYGCSHTPVYGVAIAGYIMAIVCGFIGKVLIEAGNKWDD